MTSTPPTPTLTPSNPLFAPNPPSPTMDPLTPITCDNLRLHPTPLYTCLQQHLPDSPWRTLRPIRADSTLYVILGSPAIWEVHTLDELVPHLLHHEFDIGHPLPNPLPVPEALSVLPYPALDYAIRYALGIPLSETFEALGLDDTGAQNAARDIQDAGVTLLRVPDTSNAISAHIQTWREAMRSGTLPDDPTESAQPTRTLPTPIDPIPTDGAPVVVQTHVGDIVPIPPEVLAKLQRTGAGGSVERIRWPFARMKPLTQITIRAELADKAQRAAHVYAHRHGWKLQTSRDMRTGTLIIRRIDGG